MQDLLSKAGIVNRAIIKNFNLLTNDDDKKMFLDLVAKTAKDLKAKVEAKNEVPE